MRISVVSRVHCVFWLFVACCLSVGCGPSPTPSLPSVSSGKPTPALRVLVVDDPALADLIRDQWQVRATDEQLEVRTEQSSDLATANRLSADVVVFPARSMGELVERELIQPIADRVSLSGREADEASTQIPVEDLLPTVRQCDLSWGRKLYAVTLGSPQYVLLYRPDIFAKLKLGVPTNWRDYQSAVETLADREALGELAPAEGSPWHAALEPTADGWGGITLLARAAPAVRAEGQLYALFDIDNMSSRIASPPFVQAAKDLAAATQRSSGSERRLTPAEIRAAFFDGQCGMAITWPSAADAKEAESRVAVGYAELPGSDQYFSFKTNAWISKDKNVDQRTSLCCISGRLAAVTREARRSRSAFALLAWLGGEEASRVVGMRDTETTLFTRAQLNNPAPWLGEGTSSDAAAQYAQVAQASFSRTMWMPVARLPGVDAYHAALDAAVAKVMANPDDAQEALTAAAKRWDEITGQHDLARQRRAYQRSLGNDF